MDHGGDTPNHDDQEAPEMKRTWAVIGSLAAFGLAIALVGTGDAGTAAACEKEKTRTAKAAAASEGAGCCASKSTAAAAASCDRSVYASASGPACAAAAKADGCEKSTRTAAVDELPYREYRGLVLTGSYACGHCTVGAFDECTPLFRTADGKTYRLWEGDRLASLRREGAAKNVEIATVVKKIEGVKYLEVKSYKIL
jgi:hypothetical protein